MIEIQYSKLFNKKIKIKTWGLDGKIKKGKIEKQKKEIEIK